MKINKKTSLKKIFNFNNSAIETLQSMNSVLNNIPKSTFLKYADSNVGISQLSILGDVSTNEILKKLETIGFEVELDKEDSIEKKVEENINIEGLKIVKLDVRPIIEAGSDPFKEIMQAIKVLKEEETLQIINIFVPIPLINVLEKKGFKTWTNTISNNEYHTFFTKGRTTLQKDDIEKENEKELSFDDQLASFGENKKEIDVRHLEMPEPMVTILEEIETLAENHVLLVKHKKVPQFLLAELKARNFKWMHKEVEEGFVWFMVYK